MMDAFSPIPPAWIEPATHALTFSCPHCGASVMQAKRVWMNRRAPVMGANERRKYQEFYDCECGHAWWAWSSDRPPSEIAESRQEADPETD